MALLTEVASAASSVEVVLDHANDLGWRMQVWMRDVGFSNVTYAAGVNRATSTPANNQYATPATGKSSMRS